MTLDDLTGYSREYKQFNKDREQYRGDWRFEEYIDLDLFYIL